MSLTQSLSGYSRTKQLLAKLNLTIDEARLVKKIVALSTELRVIENMSDKILRVRNLNREIAGLEDELYQVREDLNKNQIPT